MRLFHFLTWIRRLRNRLSRRVPRPERRPVQRRQPLPPGPERLIPQMLSLESRESFGDISVGGIAAAAGLTGAGVLFGAAALMLREPRGGATLVHAQALDRDLVPSGQPLADADASLPGAYHGQAGWESAANPQAVDAYFAQAGGAAADLAAADLDELELGNAGQDAAAGASAEGSAAGLLAALGGATAGGSGADLFSDPLDTAPTAPAQPGHGHSAEPSSIDDLARHLGAQRSAFDAGAAQGPAVTALPPIAMAQFPFAGTGGTIQAMTPPVTAPTASGSSALTFTPNRGQADPGVEFVAHAPGFDLYLSPDRATFSVGAFPALADQVHMQFVGANQAPELVGVSPTTAAGPAVLGAAGAGLTYGQVNYQSVYEGINLDFYVNPQGKLEHDWVVAPGADPSQIRVVYQGAERLELDGQGNLQIHTATGGLVQHAPVLYQQFGGVFEPVAGAYHLEGNQVSFTIGDYDRSRTLVIDPITDTLTPSGTFLPPWVQAAGHAPSAAATADFDHDGNDDVLIANYNGANLTLALSNGDGSFAPGVSIAAGNSPNGLAVGDLRGNGEHDLVVSNFADQTVGVLWSNGDGTFAPMTTYAVGAGPAGLALGDFDGDGHLDLATADFTAGTVSVLLNDGTGAFGPAVTYTAGAGALGLVAQDLDGDAVLDLATANYSASTVSVLLGNGDGTFATAVSYAVGLNPFAVAAGDFRQDGAPDLVTANYGAHSVSRLVNNGDGTFQTAVNTAVGTSPTGLAVGNINGRPNLVVGNFGSNDVSLLATNPDGSFQAERRFAANVTGPQGLALGDFRGDGRLGVVVAGQTSNTFGVLGNSTVQATEGVSFTGPVAWFTDSNPSAVAGDFTATIDWGDGTSSAGTVLADPAGGFVVVGTHTYETGSFALEVAIQETGPGASTTAYNLAVVTDFLSPTVEVQGTSLGATEGTALTDAVVATFTDPGGAAVLAAYSATIDWGDGSAPQAGTITYDSGSGVFSVKGTHTYAHHGSYLAAVTVTHDGRTGDNLTLVAIAEAAIATTGMFEPPVSHAAGDAPRALVTGDFNHDGLADVAVANFNGSQLTLFFGNGDGTFDAGVSVATGTGPNALAVGDLVGPAASGPSAEVAVAPTVGTETVWVEDGTPAGATLTGTWTWVSSNPTPFAGSLAHQSTLASGTHQHYFTGATNTLSVGLGDTLFAYVYLDAANPPTEVMLQWHDTTGSWDHRAYWGANSITWGTNGTNSRRYMGELPATGGWVRLEVPASLVGLEGRTLDGMAFTLYDGRATWDQAGVVTAPVGTPPGLAVNPGNGQATLTWTKFAGATSYNVYRSTTSGGQGTTPFATGVTATSFTDTGASNGTTYYYTVTAVTPAGESAMSAEASAVPASGHDTLWVEDGVPAGATLSTSGGDSWSWVDSPLYSGSAAHQSAIAAGTHQHYFTGTTQTLSVAAGESLFAYVYLDPANPPTEVMLQWHDTTGSWDHRAYWGANSITWGTNGTNSRRYMGEMPATGGWVRLEVPASLVGLEGVTLDGMAFTLYGGRATWDYAGKGAAGPALTAPGVAAQPQGGQVTLRWTATPGADSYHVYRATTSGGQGSTPYATGVTGTSFTDTAVTNGTTYYYQVVAVQAADEQDLVVSNSADDTVGVLRNNGDGTFAPLVSYAVGDAPGAVVLGDFNGDAKLDLAVANAGDGTVSVLLNNGDGTFATAVSYAAGAGAAGIVVVDLDGDDVLDLAVANAGADSVSVLLGNGDGTFAAGVTYAVGDTPVAIAAGDFREDGFPDLVTADSAGNTISRLVNNGDGTFQTAVSTAVGTAPSSLAVADLNGRPSLVVGNAGSDDVSVLLANAAGSFQAEQRFAAGDGPSGVALADVNGDGKLDIVTADQLGDTFSVLGNSSIVATSNQVFTGKVASFTSANPLADAGTFSALIDWGDGSVEPGAVFANGAGGFDVFGSHYYATAGDYTVTAQVTGSQFSIVNLAQVAAGSLVTGNYANTVIAGRKFNDTNGDGVQQSGELPLENWTIKLFVLTGGQLAATPVQTATTDVNGHYVFAGLAALAAGSNYVVVESPPDGWKQTWPTGTTPNTILLPNGLLGYVIPAAGGVPFLTSGGQLIPLVGTGTVTLNALNNGTTGTVTYDDGAGNAGTLNAHISQFNVTYHGGAGTPVTFDTFCVDLFHTVTVGQSYLVNPRGDVASAFANVPNAPANGSRIAYVYQNYGMQDLSGNADEAAAIQLVIWYLSLGTTPDAVTLQGDGSYATADGAFRFTVGGNAAAIAARFNELLTTPATVTNQGGWLDATPAGPASNRGQSLLLPTYRFDFGNQPAPERWKLNTDTPRNDPLQGTYVPFGVADVSPLTGNVRTIYPLCLDCGCGDCLDQTAGLGTARLVYNSGTVDVRPVVRATLTLDPALAVPPTSIDVQLDWNNGTQIKTVSFTPTQRQAQYVLPVQLDQALTASGIFTYKVTVTVHLPGGQDIVLEGEVQKAAVVVNDNLAETSPDNTFFGPGWDLDVRDRLAINDDGVLLIFGTGDSRMFLPGGGGSYIGQGNESGTLTFDDGLYVHTDKNGLRRTFDSSGRLLELSSPAARSRPLRFAYAGATSRLTTLTLPRLELATFTQGVTDLIVAITGPGNRVYQLSHDLDLDLVTITDPELHQKTNEYDSKHKLTRDPWGPLDQSFTYDATTGLVTGSDRGDGDTLAITSALQQALTAASPLSPDEVHGTITDALGRTTTYTLDNLGRLTSMQAPDSSEQSWLRNAGGYAVAYTDELGRVTRMAYDAFGDLLSRTFADGSSEHYVYDNSFHQVTRYTDTLGHATTFRYDPATGDLLEQTDALGQVTAYVWSGGLLMSTADALGRRTRYRYDGERHLVEMTDAEGNATGYTYDGAGNLETVTDALGRVTTYVHDGLRRVTQITDAAGGAVSMTYDAIGDLTSRTDQLGRTTTYVYSQRGLLTSVTEAVGTSQQRISTFDYDAVGNLTATTDALGRVTAYAYDVRDRLIELTEAVGTAVERSTAFGYDLVSNLLTATDALGRVSAYVYDNRNRMTQMTEAVGTAVERSTFVAYDSESNVLSTTDALGRVTGFTYDVLNRVVSTTEAVGTAVERTSSVAYDAVGNLASTTDALGRVTEYAYNDVNLLVGMTEAVGTAQERTSTLAYDAVYNLASTTDPLGRTTQYVYDALDRMTAMTEAVGTSVERTSSWSYDAASNLTSMTDALGRVSAYVYDALDRQISLTEAVGTSVERTTSWGYDAVSNLTSTTDALGRITNYSFDALDRLTAMTEAVGTAVERTSALAYDTLGNLVGTTDALGRVTAFVYDALNRTSAVTEAVGTAVERTTLMAYDANDNQTSMTDALGRVTAYGYDALDRLTSLTEAVGTSVERTSSLAYDANSNLVSTTDALGRVTAYVYDALDRTVSLTEAVGTAVERTTQYAHDAVNNYVSTTDALGRVTAFVYDALDRQVAMTEAVGTSVGVRPANRVPIASTGRTANVAGSSSAGGRVSIKEKAPWRGFPMDALCRPRAPPASGPAATPTAAPAPSSAAASAHPSDRPTVRRLAVDRSR